MKELLRLFIYFVSFLFNKDRKSKMIYYHDVGLKYTNMGTPLDLIKKHISIIRLSSFDIVDNITKPENEIMIAFDDGWKGLYDAKDYFVQENIFPTVFIAVNLIGKEGYLSVDQIKILMGLGFKFQAHSWSHFDLTTYSGKSLDHELVDSKRKLETLFGKEFNSLCFPQGKYSDMVVERAKSAGYSNLYSSVSGGYYDMIEKGIICRNLVQTASPTLFRLIIESSSKIVARRNIKQHYKKKR